MHLSTTCPVPPSRLVWPYLLVRRSAAASHGFPWHGAGHPPRGPKHRGETRKIHQSELSRQTYINVVADRDPQEFDITNPTALAQTRFCVVRFVSGLGSKCTAEDRVLRAYGSSQPFSVGTLAKIRASCGAWSNKRRWSLERLRPFVLSNHD